MIRVLRWTGFLLIVSGAFVALTYFIEPFRELWPWLMDLPLPIRIGVGMAGAGLLILFSSIIAERFGEREYDQRFREERTK